MMHATAIARALAGVALTALAVTAQPTLAQTPSTTTPSTAPTPRPITTPGAAPSPTASPLGGTTSGSRGQSPSALPGAAGTPAPGAPAGSTGAASGGSGAINAAAIPTLAPADQREPLPYPAYGTPAPASPPRVVAGVPQVVTLQQAILIAYARSPLLASARADVAIATAPVGLAQSALFPAVTGSASTTRSHRQEGASSSSSSGGTGGTGSGSTFKPDSTSNSLSVDLDQLIFDGGRVAAQIRAARFTQSASVATYQRELQTVAFNVATAYYNTLAAERQTQVGLTTVQLDQVQENLVSAQIRAGTAAKADLATAQLPTAQARVSVVRAQATEQTDLATFANVLGLDADVAVQPKDDVGALSATSGTIAVNPAFPTPTYDQAITRAVALRPDLTAQQQSVASLEASLRAAKLGNFPSVSGTASYGTSSTDASGGTFRNAGSIGVALTVPVYDRGVTRAQTAQAQGQLDRGVAQLAITQQGIQLNVRTALANLVSAYAALDQVNAELSKAQQVLRSTQAQYRAGVTTLPLLLNAQVGLTQALTDEVTAVYTVRQAEQALLFAEGANAAG
ncbi:MAG: TolC family protein [Candidatus Eremiobacteraeota bacterium]|nr:TolC family protein [Candidatus Eremiobacteraeota bacterium]